MADRSSNIPILPDRFFAREEAMAGLRQALDVYALVTLVGPGGIGKTRLAIETAAGLTDEFSDGVWLVELAPLSDDDLVAAEAIRSLGIPERSGTDPVDTLVNHFANKVALLLVDNCEHVIPGVAELARHLLAAAPGLALMCTSRQPLRVPGEHVWPVDVLAPPRSDLAPDDLARNRCVQLFAERAKSAHPEFELTHEVAADVGRLCRRLEGIPLAVELAAAQVAAIAPAQLAEELYTGVDLLDTRREDGSHHRTMRAAIDWSVDLLDPETATVFERCSTFAGGWTSDALAKVVMHDLPRPPLGPMAELVRASLVVADHRGPTSRYRMLEPIRQYAMQRLTSEDRYDLAERHANHFHVLVTELDADLRGPDQERAYDIVTAEIDNVRASFDHLIATQRATEALELTRALRTYWSELMTDEGLRRAHEALAIADDLPVTTRAGGLADASWIAYTGGAEEAEALARGSVELTDAAGLDPDPEAVFTIGMSRFIDGDFEEALRLYELGTQLGRVIDDDYEITAGLAAQCVALTMLGRDDEAIGRGEESLEIAERLGYGTQVAGTLACLGVAHGQTDPARAVTYLNKSLALKDDTAYSGLSRVIAGHLSLMLGRIQDALDHFVEAIDVLQRSGYLRFLPATIDGLAGTIAMLGDARTGSRLLGGAQAVRTELQTPAMPVEIVFTNLARAVMTSSADDGDSLDRFEEAGQRLSVDEAVAAARELGQYFRGGGGPLRSDEPDELTVQPPALVGRYRVEKVLGAGAFTTVYLAHDDALEVSVAVKVLAENLSFDPNVRRRFIQEARILRRCQHEHLVAVHDIGQTEGGQPFFVMDLADRGSLRERLQDRSDLQVPLAELRRLCVALADGVGALHAAGVAHRDLKPSNILLRSTHGGETNAQLLADDERLLVADLGLARPLTSGSRLTAAVGTPGYMAPEQRDPAGGVDERADIYSCTALVVRLLTGSVTVDPERERHGAVRRFLATGLAADPADRFATIIEWARAVTELLDSASSLAASDSGPIETAMARTVL